MAADVTRPGPERNDVFDVLQVTLGTPLEEAVGADLVDVEPHQSSGVHRHNQAETVLYILDGEAVIRVGDDEVSVRAGDRLLVRRGQFHGVTTGERALRFLSVQSPPILNKARGTLDFELEGPNSS